MTYFLSQREACERPSVFGEEMFENIVDEDVEVAINAIEGVEFERGCNNQIQLHQLTEL